MTWGARASGALAALLLATAVAMPPPAAAQTPEPQEPPGLADRVASGDLPPVAERLPDNPRVIDLGADETRQPGRSGGEIAWLARRSKDIRIMNVYGYARLVVWTPEFELVPDILEEIEVEDDRIFTLHLREGHRWSDGEPFTTEDFRYKWEDVWTNEDLSPYGPDSRLLVDGARPEVTVIDETTIRYAWPAPNPEFLPALAGATPLYLYAPAHHMKQYHADYADPDALQAAIDEAGLQDWVAIHIVRGDLYDADNPDLPVLQPWQNTTAPPSERFTFERNPFFHRVDGSGMQLPYLDRVFVGIADSSLIPAKTGAGDSDLQARSLRFDNVTFLKDAEERADYQTRLWETALGSEVALYPNLNVADPEWRALNRDVRFRRALSLAIDRTEISNVIYFGLARPSNNTALPASPLYQEERAQLYTELDIDRANALLDEIGLTERNSDGIRLLPDGRPLEIVVQTAGERTVEIDVLQLIAETWEQIGVGVFPSPSSRDVFRQRVFAGEAVMSIWTGRDNALFTAQTVPHELAPVDQNWLQYPAWGQYEQTGGDAGTAPDLDWGERLMTLYETWLGATSTEERAAIIDEMLDIHAEQVTSIGVVEGVPQPVVVSNRLHNVPQTGIYSWDPGAHFGMYQPDTFWVDAD
jgi:peptide/nickel transport system substrate-binding protein